LMRARDAPTGASDLPDGTIEMPAAHWHDGQIRCALEKSSERDVKPPRHSGAGLSRHSGASEGRATMRNCTSENPSGRMSTGSNGFRTAAYAASGMTEAT